MEAPRIREFPRESSIDILRGICMLLMLLDHIREYWNVGVGINPMDIDRTNAALFFTRWITNIGAPGFFFLSGLSTYIARHRNARTSGETMRKLFKRGLALIVLELTIVSLCWGHFILYNGVFLQAIWVMGVSFILLSAFQNLPSAVVGMVGLFVIATHNLLPDAFMYEHAPRLVWSLLHVKDIFVVWGKWEIYILYPIIPWFALMFLGFALGTYYCERKDRKRKVLLSSGLSTIALAVLLRATNLYGDPLAFHDYGPVMKTVFSFLATEKYPPSLQFILMNLGQCLLLLYVLDGKKLGERNVVITFGRAPLFFYVAHLYLILITTVVSYMTIRVLFPKAAITLPFSFGLWVTYALLPLYSASLYFLNARYLRYKRTHKNFITDIF